MKRTKIISSVIAAASIMFSGAAIAQDKAPGSGPNPYVDCGIGAALFPNTHWAAITSNVIWDIGTTAVISATASPETCQGKSAQAAQYILDVYDHVVENTARGEGEHLTALLQIYGCETKSHEVITDAVREGIAPMIADEEYNSLNPVQKAEQLFKIVDSEVSVAQATSCNAA